MDDVVGDDNVSKLFAENMNCYITLLIKYKNVEFNKFVYDNACDIANKCIHTDDLYTSESMINKHTHAINVDHVQYAISKLKSGKSDCVANLYS